MCMQEVTDSWLMQQGMESQGAGVSCVWNEFMEKYEKGIFVVRKCLMPRRRMKRATVKPFSENVLHVITS